MTAGQESYPEIRIATLDLSFPSSQRHGRAFFPADQLPTIRYADLALAFEREFADADDRRRLSLLERALAHQSLTVVTYPGEETPTEWHAYVVASDISEAPIFACVLAPTTVIRHLLSEPPHVVLETATFQSLGDDVTIASVTAAMETWIRRVFPDAKVPQVYISPWPGAVETKELTLEILRLSRTVPSLESAVAGPEAYSPPATIVAEEYRLPGAA
ncbi:MAG TPA: hypothetical protein VIK01_05175 [Polyangiaceae bacterium]